MNALARVAWHSHRVAASAALVMLLGYAGFAAGDEIKVTLGGNQEIPPVTTTGSGIGVITVDADKSIRGSVTISGMSATVAHIHAAAAGANGSIIVPLVKTSDNVWAVPAGAKLTDAQYESFKAGNLYFNVHSEAFKAGEIRGQIRP